MIREEDLREAIAECEGARNPTSSTCIKLAAYYALLNQKFPKSSESENPDVPRYSFASMPDLTFGDSEFSKTVEEKGIGRCFPIIEETMGALEIVMPKLFNAMMRKLEEV